MAVVIAVSVVVVVLRRSNVLHLVDAAALGASLDRALAGHLEVDQYHGRKIASCRAVIGGRRSTHTPSQ